MITIKQASEQLGITPQAIYKRINNPEASQELLNEIVTNEKNQKCVTDEGLKILEGMFPKSSQNEPVLNENNELIELLRNDLKIRTNEIYRLHEEINQIRREYHEQLKRKDDQIEKLQNMNENSQSIIFAMQQAQSKRKLLDFFKKNDD